MKEHPEYKIIHSNLEERSYFALKEAKKLGVPVRISHSHNRPLGFDLFLLPSLFEGLPVTMVEAQASGLPCVISDKVPIQCDITGNVKVVALEDSPEKWAEAVLEFESEFDRKDTFDKIVKAGFDIQENAKWLEEFYREGVGGEWI